MARKATQDYNLAVRYPELLKEWHPTRNGDLTPWDVTHGSSRKVWWICHKGHEWDAVIFNRIKGIGCPYCSGNKVGEDNNLAVRYPDIAKEWHPTKNKALTPYNVTPRSGRKVWWRCKVGHEWDSIIANRTISKGCPYCSGKRVIKVAKEHFRIENS